jgi:hypothetical protein
MLYKTGFGIAFILVLFISFLKWMIPAISIWIVISPFLFLSAIVLCVWVIEALFELFKILLNLAVIGFIIYLLFKVLVI